MYLLTSYHYTVIYRFSASTAAESTEQSDSVLEGAVKMLSAVLGAANTAWLSENASFAVRKLAHFTIFFILGFMLTMMTEGEAERSFEKRAAKALLCGLLGAAFDEWHQYFVPGRSAELRDVCIDFFGVLTGCTFYGFLRNIFVRGLGGFGYEKTD